MGDERNGLSNLARTNFPYLTEATVLTAIAITFLNDHFLKYQFPGFLTGKLSDFSGLYYVPFFLYGLLHLVMNPRGPHRQIEKKYFVCCLLVVDLTFVVLKMTDVRIIFVEFFSRHFFKIQIVPDPGDLMALVMNVPSYLTARKFFKVR